MAGFHNNIYSKFDTYMTPKIIWENIKHGLINSKINQK